MAIVSIIIPVYNTSSTLERCISSILTNTFKDFELILVEDGSSDNSWEICEKLAQRHEQIIALKNAENRGVSYTRNRGLEAASGRYIMFVDSDDWLFPDYFECFLRQLSVDPQAFIVCGFMNHDEKYNHRVDEKSWNNSGDTLILDTAGALEGLYDKVLLQQLWNKVFLRSVIVDNHLCFDETISIGEDFRFVLSYLKCIDGHTVTILDKPLYHYMRDRADSLMYHVGYEGVEESLKNLQMLYELEGFSQDDIERKLISAREHQLESYAYLIMHNRGMGISEKKRLIRNLDQSKGKSLYSRHRWLYIKERLAGLIHRH